MVLAKTQIYRTRAVAGIKKRSYSTIGALRAMNLFEARVRAMTLEELRAMISLHLLYEPGAGERDDNCVDIAIFV
jgi:hypothetical protein